MPVTKNFQTSANHSPFVLRLLAQPRFLRAVPPLLVLTTAIAWGNSSHAGGLALEGALFNTTAVAVAAGPVLSGGVGLVANTGLGAQAGTKAGSGGMEGRTGVRTGINNAVTAEQRMAAQGAGGVGTSTAVNGAAQSTGRTVGGVRATAETDGSAAARTGQRLTPGVKGNLSAGISGTTGLQSRGMAGTAGNAGGVTVNSDLGAGVKSVR